MSDHRPEGQLGAHTPADRAGGAAASAEDAWSAPLPGADPLDLLAGSPDLDASDLLALAAEPVLSQRRARGRPEGALNRKNNDMIKYLQSLGHRDPWVTLSLIQSADTMRLAMLLRVPMQEEGRIRRDLEGNVLYNHPDPQFVAALQERAATTLMKYHHSAKPQQLELPTGDKRPVMVIGEMNVTMGALDGFMSAGVAPTIEGEKANEINGGSVRHDEDQSHGEAKALKDNDDPASTA